VQPDKALQYRRYFTSDDNLIRKSGKKIKELVNRGITDLNEEASESVPNFLRGVPTYPRYLPTRSLHVDKMQVELPSAKVSERVQENAADKSASEFFNFIDNSLHVPSTKLPVQPQKLSNLKSSDDTSDSDLVDTIEGHDSNNDDLVELERRDGVLPDEEYVQKLLENRSPSIDESTVMIRPNDIHSGPLSSHALRIIKMLADSVGKTNVDKQELDPFGDIAMFNKP